jgi:hypothetical protein
VAYPTASVCGLAGKFRVHFNSSRTGVSWLLRSPRAGTVPPAPSWWRVRPDAPGGYERPPETPREAGTMYGRARWPGRTNAGGAPRYGVPLR